MKKVSRVSIIDSMLVQKTFDSKQIIEAVLKELGLNAEDKVLKGRIRNLIYVRKSWKKKNGEDVGTIDSSIKTKRVTKIKKTEKNEAVKI